MVSQVVGHDVHANFGDDNQPTGRSRTRPRSAASWLLIRILVRWVAGRHRDGEGGDVIAARGTNHCRRGFCSPTADTIPTGSFAGPAQAAWRDPPCRPSSQSPGFWGLTALADDGLDAVDASSSSARGATPHSAGWRRRPAPKGERTVAGADPLRMTLASPARQQSLRDTAGAPVQQYPRAVLKHGGRPPTSSFFSLPGWSLTLLLRIRLALVASPLSRERSPHFLRRVARLVCEVGYRAMALGPNPRVCRIGQPRPESWSLRE